MGIFKDLIVTGVGRFLSKVYASEFVGKLTGNADSAAKLKTPRTINGTSFDGSADITTATWGAARNINGMSVQGDANRVNYGTCSTAAATAAKTVDCAGFELITGSEITVKFTVTNTATQPTLNVNGTGAKDIRYRGDYIPPSYLANGRVYTFRYDGTRYELVGDINTDTNTDTKVTQNSVNDNASYPLLLTPKGQSASTTTTACFDSGVTLNPSTNTINANISGNAATATTAKRLETSNVGSSTQPVYFSNGVPVAGASYYTKNVVGHLDWDITADQQRPLTKSAIAFWNGAYQGTDSNLVYCKRGAFGSIVTKSENDYVKTEDITEYTADEIQAKWDEVFNS